MATTRSDLHGTCLESLEPTVLWFEATYKGNCVQINAELSNAFGWRIVDTNNQETVQVGRGCSISAAFRMLGGPYELQMLGTIESQWIAVPNHPIGVGSYGLEIEK